MKPLLLIPLVAVAAFGAIDGTIVNQTTGRPQPGASISVMTMSQDGMQPLGSALTDGQGRFTINQSPQGPALVQAEYQGVTYSKMVPPGTPTTGLHIDVYDSSHRAGDAKVAQHIFIFEPASSKLNITETFFYSNDGKVTFNNPAEGTVRFFLPPAAGGDVKVSVTPPGGVPIDSSADKTAKANIYKIDYPIRPGETRLDLTYAVPFSDGGVFSTKLIDHSFPTRLVAPAGVTLTGDNLSPLGEEPQTKATIFDVKGEAFKITIQGSGAAGASSGDSSGDDDSDPGVEEIPPAIYGHKLVLLGLSLVILALGFLMLYRRGSLPAAAEPAPVKPPQKGKRRS